MRRAARCAGRVARRSARDTVRPRASKHDRSWLAGETGRAGRITHLLARREARCPHRPVAGTPAGIARSLIGHHQLPCGGSLFAQGRGQVGQRGRPGCEVTCHGRACTVCSSPASSSARRRRPGNVHALTAPSGTPRRSVISACGQSAKYPGSAPPAARPGAAAGHRKGKPGTARRAHEHRRAFRRAAKWRTGGAGRISSLKRGYCWDRTCLDGTEGARIWAGHSFVGCCHVPGRVWVRRAAALGPGSCGCRRSCRRTPRSPGTGVPAPRRRGHVRPR